ncbi:aldehyde dehydrogenase [Pelomyxa schiedti]|nr:aldehyde dehydrogenase [Pelomyxa schiedti]
MFVSRSVRSARLRSCTERKYECVKKSTISSEVVRLRKTFEMSLTRPMEWRLRQLLGLRDMITENRNQLSNALHKDLGRPQMEANVADIDTPLSELQYIISQLRYWVRPKKVRTNLLVMPSTAYVYPDPLGVVCIMSPWNYPINLALVPLFGAFAAGNCVFLKLSRHSPNVSNLLAELLPRYVDMSALAIEPTGGADVIQDILRETFDHIFFTGSPNVGKIVYQAASQNLTPVVLELGGKNPCIVDATADLKNAAKKISWGKFFNAGQTCIAPDYLFVHESVADAFVTQLRKRVEYGFGPNPRESTSFGRIVNLPAFNRLSSYLRSGDVIFGGETSAPDLYVAPTLMRNVNTESPLMNEEIFGPILPMLTYKDISEVIQFIKTKPHPLALYMFSTDSKATEYVLSHTASGGACTNDTLVHFPSHSMPFGGVGGSGLGKYHGKGTFKTFVNPRAVVKGALWWWWDFPLLRYPPYSTVTTWIVKFVASLNLSFKWF